MTDLLAKTIQTVVEKQFNMNADNIHNSLFSHTSRDMSSDEIYSIMIFNSIKESVNISVQLIIEMLVNAGAIEISDDEHLRRLLLSVVED